MSEPWRDYAPPASQDEGPWVDYSRTEGPVKRKSLALGLYSGLMKPLDNAAMALEAGAKRVGIPTDRINNLFSSPSAAEAAAAHQQYIEHSANRPAASTEALGKMVMTAPLMAATRNPFALGAAQGALTTDARAPEGVITDAAKGAALNYAGGKVLDTAADALAPVIDPAVRRLVDAGVKVTPGMRRGGKAMAAEDKAISRPIVGDAIAGARQQTQDTLNTAAVNKALSSIGKSVPTPVKPGHDAVDYAKGEIGREYDRIVPNLAVTMDPKQFVQNLGSSFSTLPKSEQDQFIAIANQHLKDGRLAGQGLKDAQEVLRRTASNYTRSDNPAQRDLGQLLWEADDELSGAMMAQNPKWAPDLQKVNEAYRGYRIVADAAGRADSGVFNTGQLKQAVRRGDRTKNKDASARGQAFMQDFSNDAREVIPSRVPDSGTAGRQQAGNLFALGAGVADAGRFKADQLWNELQLGPRPAWTPAAGEFLRRLRAPAAAGAVAASEPRD